MALLMSWLIDAAATAIGDPHKQRVKQPQWNQIATLALNDVCSTYNILEYEDGFDLPADGIITYPEACVRVTEIRASLTPAVESSFTKLDEKFEDEWNLTVKAGGIGSDAVPTQYYADKGVIRLNATQAAAVVNGGRISYIAVPPEVVDPATYNLPVPEFMRSYFCERLRIGALFADEREDEAAAAFAVWHAREEAIRTQIDHRALDRREALRPTAGRSKYGGMA